LQTFLSDLSKFPNL